jgi:pimeloyl-ACP methyl ester carboxylesterase
MKRLLTLAVLAATLSFTLVAPAHAATGVNDPTCRSTAHPNPVVVLHGLGANKDEDLNFLQADLARQHYCTFALTYGAPGGQAFVGGLEHIAVSAAQIKTFIEQVLAQTGAAKVDIVGHSEGGFQSLYVTKTQGISSRIAHVVAIAPPAHGTTFGGLMQLADVFGASFRSVLDGLLTTFGCPACDDLITGGPAITTLNDGPIAQPGVSYTVITSKYDELVTPTGTAFVNEPGVKNLYVQDSCPFDPVGHIGEAYDLNVWHLVTNALDPAHATPILFCFAGSPG